MWKKIWQLLKPYKVFISISLMISICITALNAAIPILQQRVIDAGILKSDAKIVVILSSIIVILVVFREGITYLNQKLQISMNLRFIRNMQIAVLKHALKLRQNYLKDDGILKIINDADYNIQTISRITGSDFFSIILQIFTVVGVAIGLFLIEWKLALLVMITIPCRFIISKSLEKAVARSAQFAIFANRELHKWENDVYTSGAVNEIKLWNLYGKKANEYEKLLKNRDETTKKVNLTMCKQNLYGNGFQGIFLNLLYIVTAYMIWGNELTIGGLLTFLTYSNMLVQPVGLIATIKLIINQLKPALASYEEFLEMEEEEGENYPPLLPKENFELIFNNVSFSYGEKSILKGANFKLKCGEKVAIVGENGSGKSTLINLILRFINPCQGKICIDSNNIQTVGLESYRNIIAVVTQFPYLFQGSISENITISINELEEETLLEFINKLPEKFNTVVGPDSGNISGGEKQKIALFRALEKGDGKIIVLDEATSNYDQLSEKLFQNRIKKIKNKLVLLVTHREELLKSVDKILFIKNGEVFVFDNFEKYELFLGGKRYGDNF